MTKAFVMHPNFLKHTGIEELPESPQSILFGVPFYYDRSLEKWEPPQDPFIEYEPRDYGWLRKLGFGCMVPQCYEFNMPLIPQLF